MSNPNIAEFCREHSLPEDETREQCTLMILESAKDDPEVLGSLQRNLAQGPEENVVPFPEK